METQERMEREINLKDLFWAILLGWRQIICFAILFAVLISGMRYFLDSRSYRNIESMDIELEREELKEEDIKNIEKAKELALRIEDYENYLDTAPLMQIDPYAKPILEIQYYVDSDYIINYTKDRKHDYTSDITAMYSSYIRSGEMSRKVIEMAKLPISQEEFGELYSVSQTEASMTITVTYPEEDKLETIAESIKTLLSQKEPEFQEIGEHTLKVVNEYQNTVIDTELLEKKTNIITNISNLDTQLTTAKGALSAQQLHIMEEEVDQEIQKKLGKEAEEEDEVPGFSLKYLILGAFVGIFLVCAVIACRVIFTAKLQNSEEIRSLYGVRLLGEVNTSTMKKRFLSVIDNKLLAIKDRRKKKLTMEQQIKIVCANIAISCKQQGIDCIYMTGSEYEHIDKKVLDMLKKELTAQNVQVKEGVNMFYDASSLKQGTDIGNILFVEQKNQSIYNEISNEINLMKEQENNILGVVVLD